MNKDNRPSVSIIMPNRNYGRFVGDAIRSILAQTLSDWECIIVDDASTDDSVDVIRSEIKDDPRFKLFVNDSCLGISAARNIGLDNASGEYIAFLDSDDCYVENALELLLYFAITMNVDVVGGLALIVPVDFSYIPRRVNGFEIPMFVRQNERNILIAKSQNMNWVWVWRRIYRRDVLKDVRFCPEFTGIGDDTCFMLQVCAQTNRIIELQSVTVYHRYHSSSVSNGAFAKEHFSWVAPLLEFFGRDLIHRYNPSFLRFFYRQMFHGIKYETIVAPIENDTLKKQARQALIDTCKLIPRRYLSLKDRILCWFFSCMK